MQGEPILKRRQKKSYPLNKQTHTSTNKQICESRSFFTVGPWGEKYINKQSFLEKEQPEDTGNTALF